jgi:hypothetical protein
VVSGDGWDVMKWSTLAVRCGERCVESVRLTRSARLKDKEGKVVIRVRELSLNS